MKNIILTLGFFLGTISFTLAQSDTLTVSATIGAGNSSLTINETAIGFDGTLQATDGSSRFESNNVTGSYFIANGGAGGWKIIVSTQNDGDIAGLVDGTTNNNIAQFKVDQGADGDVTDDIDWEDEDEAEFSFVLDDSADVENAASVASSENEDLTKNDSLVFNFGVDIAGKPVGTYSATVIVELVLLP